MSPLHRCLCVLVLALLGACATTPEQDEPEKVYYERAREALNRGNFSEAITQLEALDARYPFGRYAEQAQLDMIYARYRSLEPESAIIAAERFIRLNPQSPHVDYAYYIKGLANYYADVSLGARYFSVDADARDPGRQRDAFNDFNQLVTSFPDSPYAADAAQRMIAIKNRLAAYELKVARYYIKREAYVAAAERAKYVVQHLPETPAAPDALALLVELYQVLGLNEQSKNMEQVLVASYPNHASLDENQEFIGREVIRENRSLKGVLTFGWLED